MKVRKWFNLVRDTEHFAVMRLCITSHDTIVYLDLRDDTTQRAQVEFVADRWIIIIGDGAVSYDDILEWIPSPCRNASIDGERTVCSIRTHRSGKGNAPKTL